jgi:hypothetical protein
MKISDLNHSVTELMKANSYYPFAFVFRVGPALRLGNANAENAKEELEQAIKIDPSPDLLALATFVNLDDIIVAQRYYNMFKLVDKKSPLIEFIKAKK